MTIVVRGAWRVVFWVSVGAAVTAVALACLGTVLAREARVLSGRARAARHLRRASRAVADVPGSRVPDPHPFRAPAMTDRSRSRRSTAGSDAGSGAR